MSGAIHPAAAAVATKGWAKAHRWLLLRRASQLFFLGLFLAGPLVGLWLVKGTLSASLTLDLLPLTDPYVVLQSLVAGHLPEATALIGGIIVALVYGLLGGRLYCSFVCPINPITDGAHFLARQLDLPKGWQPPRTTRLWLLGATFVVAAGSGTIAWELVNPVSLLFRGLLFGLGLAWLAFLGLCLFDLLLSRHGWCGRLCPVGAFYGLLGSFSLLRVSAKNRAACDDCMDCFAVCPEPHVITPALKGAPRGAGPIILSRDCTDCGRCIDVCAKDVFAFDLRFNNSPAAPEVAAPTRPMPKGGAPANPRAAA
jgi:ferredoxin-type protein NapH